MDRSCVRFLYSIAIPAMSIALNNAWKVSVFGVILVQIFPDLDWIWGDTPYLSVYGHFLRSIISICNSNSSHCRLDIEKIAKILKRNSLEFDMNLIVKVPFIYYMIWLRDFLDFFGMSMNTLILLPHMYCSSAKERFLVILRKWWPKQCESFKTSFSIHQRREVDMFWKT